MDETTVFGKGQAQPPQSPPGQPPTPPAPPQFESPLYQQQLYGDESSAIAPPQPPNEGGGSFLSGTIIKIAIGIVVVLLLLFGLIFLLSHKSTPKVQNVTLTYWELWEDNNVMASVLDDLHRQYQT